MILRRVIEHFRKQEWTAIFLDFVIVVAGVFVGLQVNNWNEAQAEAAQEHDILVGIAQDLRSDQAELKAGAANLLASIGAANYTLAAIGEARIETLVQPWTESSAEATPVPRTADPRDDEKDHLWAYALASFYPTGSVSAFDALTNTGKIGIIKDRDLTRALQAYRQKWLGLDETHAGTMRPLRNNLISIGDRYGLSPTAIPEADFLRIVKEHEELPAALRSQIVYKTRHYQIIAELERSGEEILATLASKGVNE